MTVNEKIALLEKRIEELEFYSKKAMYLPTVETLEQLAAEGKALPLPIPMFYPAPREHVHKCESTQQ